jgi:PEP-CTERM motif
MRKLFAALAIAASMGAAAPASAALYNFQFSGTNMFGSPSQTQGMGVFTTSDTSHAVVGDNDPGFTILGITGEVNGVAINAPTIAGGYGNYFTTGPAFLDGTGVVFFAGATRVDFFFQDPPTSLYRVNTQSPGASGFVTASSSQVAAVPEPATWAMMVLGFAGVGFMAYRRRNDMRTVRIV